MHVTKYILMDSEPLNSFTKMENVYITHRHHVTKDLCDGPKMRINVASSEKNQRNIRTLKIRSIKRVRRRGTAEGLEKIVSIHIYQKIISKIIVK